MSPIATFEPRWFADRNQLYDTLCSELESLLGLAVAARSRASLAVAGGTTPIPLFERLAQRPLPWQSITVTLTDERWVKTDDPSSNEGLVRRCLAHDRAAAVNVVGLYTGDPDPAEAIAECSARLARISQPLEAVVLGTGEDGHVASLFPGAVETGDALAVGSRARYVAVSPPASAVAPGNRRLSMTVGALVDTRRLMVLATGATKRALIERVRAGAPESADWPLAKILRQDVVPAEIWWAP